MSRRVALVAATILALLASGCGDDDSVRRIDEDSDGATVELTAGETLEIRLEANPTTGYEWVVLEPGVLELVSRSHRPDSDATGSGGITTLTFRASGTGTADLELAYQRPWEEDVPPIDVFTVRVVAAG